MPGLKAPRVQMTNIRAIKPGCQVMRGPYETRHDCDAYAKAHLVYYVMPHGNGTKI